MPLGGRGRAPPVVIFTAFYQCRLAQNMTFLGEQITQAELADVARQPPTDHALKKFIYALTADFIAIETGYFHGTDVLL